MPSPGTLTLLSNNRKRGGGKSGFHKRKNFLENYPQILARALRISASPVLGRKILKNIGWKGRQIINLSGAHHMSRANPVLKKVDPRVWAAFISLIQDAVADCYEHGNENFGSVKDRIPSLVERLATSLD